jgi:hypothetical protein
MVVAGLVAAIAVVMTGLGTEVAQATLDLDYEHSSDFRLTCLRAGGVFTDTGDGDTWCQWPDSSQTVCDANGKGCSIIPVKSQEPAGRWDAQVGTFGKATLGEDKSSLETRVGTIVAPESEGAVVEATDPAPPLDTTAVLVAEPVAEPVADPAVTGAPASVEQP